MEFKNQFEESIYNISSVVFGNGNTQIEHNKVICIEDKTAKSTISFTGPPKKEIDVLSIKISKTLKVQLLISCKKFNNSKAEPAHVQEWCSVVNTMDKHSLDSRYIGIVISSSGFSSGCEAWASSENIALVPPLKGNGTIFTEQQVIDMFNRICIALSRRLKFPFEDMLIAPNFFDFCFKITSDFEGFVNANTSSRYKKLDKNWNSNFSELVHTLIGRQIESIHFANEKFYLFFDKKLVLCYSENKIEFGELEKVKIENEETPCCTKNFSKVPISFDSIKEMIIGARISSAADFIDHIELGIDRKLNLGLLPPNKIYAIIFNEIQKT